MSWRRPLARSGSDPVSRASAARSVSTSPAAGERAVSAVSSSRGRPLAAIASRLMTAMTLRLTEGAAAKRAAPIAPSAAPSVERKTREYGSFARGPAPVGAYERASSISAAVPDALSFRPDPVPVSSRCAITTIRLGESPAFSTERFTSRTFPRPGTFARKAVAVDGEAVGGQLTTEPGGRARRAGRPGRSARITEREVVGDLGRSGAIERGRQVRRLEGRGSGDAEREQEEREADEQPCAAVETSVDRTLERSWPWPAPLG